jgi:hypothetical protein
MMLLVSTPFDVKIQAHSENMDEIAKLRVDRLVAALKRRKLCLGEDGEVQPRLLSEALINAGVKGSYPYCRDILAKENRSFAGAKAREIESALGLPALCLDGAADWPFRVLTPAQWAALNEKLKEEIEQRLLGASLMQSSGGNPTIQPSENRDSRIKATATVYLFPHNSMQTRLKDFT